VNVAVEPAGAPRVAGVQEGAAAQCVAPSRAITLSDTWGQGERALSRGYTRPAVCRAWSQGRAEQSFGRVATGGVQGHRL